MSYQISTSYTLRFPRYSPDKILKVKVTTARSNVKARSHHDVAHLQPPTNVPAKYHLPTPYGCRDIARTRFSNSRSDLTPPPPPGSASAMQVKSILSFKISPVASAKNKWFNVIFYIIKNVCCGRLSPK